MIVVFLARKYRWLYKLPVAHSPSFPSLLFSCPATNQQICKINFEGFLWKEGLCHVMPELLISGNQKLMWLVRLRLRLQNVFEGCILSPTLQVSVYKEESRPSWPSAGILTVLLYAGIQGQQRSWFFFSSPLRMSFSWPTKFTTSDLLEITTLYINHSPGETAGKKRSIADFLVLSFLYHIHYIT